VTQKIKTMPTDPARVHRTDPGEPTKCPVWNFHQVYSSPDIQDWVQKGCRTAGIGCVDCKKPVIAAVLAEQEPIRERAAMYENDPNLVQDIIQTGAKAARQTAQETMSDVREIIGLLK